MPGQVGAKLEGFNMAATVEGTQGHASLVTDVLQKTGRLEKENYQACIRKMLKKADEVKVGARD